VGEERRRGPDVEMNLHLSEDSALLERERGIIINAKQSKSN